MRGEKKTKKQKNNPLITLTFPDRIFCSVSEDIRGSLSEEHLHTLPDGRFLPTDSGLDVSDTVCTSNRCLESTDRCSGCKLEAIAKAVWCVEESLFPVR